MNGSHGEKPPFHTAKDRMRGFKGASDVIKNGKELMAWQKVYQQKTCDPVNPRLLAGEPETFGELLRKRT